jgi:hypothetical protein
MTIIRTIQKRPLLLSIVIVSLASNLLVFWLLYTTALNIGTGLLSVFAFLIPLCAVLYLLGSGLVKKDALCLLGALAIIAGFIAANYALQPLHAALHKQTQADGLRLYQAIGAYQQDKNRLPADMEDLVPHYIPAIPQPAFHYCDYSFHGKKTTGTLIYDYPVGMICELQPNGTWIYHD